MFACILVPVSFHQKLKILEYFAPSLRYCQQLKPRKLMINELFSELKKTLTEKLQKLMIYRLFIKDFWVFKMC